LRQAALCTDQHLEEAEEAPSMSDEKPVAKRNKPALDNQLLPHKMPDAKVVAKRLGLTADDRLQQKMQEITQLIWLPPGLAPKEMQERVVRALELFESLEPEDVGQSMLALHMVGTHLAAMECLRRAAQTDQSLAGRDKTLNLAAKLMALYEKQHRAFQKAKGKGQQKVTVEHVNVQAGGQAIVGNVQTGASPAPAQANGKPGASSEGIAEAADMPFDRRPEASIRVRRPRS
jgi:hypothetical protein